MAIATEGEANGYTFQWKIENVSNLWWLDVGEEIESPTFIADAWGDTKWSLLLSPMVDLDENYVGFHLKRQHDCGGPDAIEICYQLSFLGKDDSILKEEMCKIMKNDIWGFSEFERRERVFVTERETFLPEDTLTAQCTLWTKDAKLDKSYHLFATSAIKVKRRSFVWKIDKPSILKSGIRNHDLDRLCADMSSFDETIKYVSCKTSIIDSEGRKENIEIKRIFESDLKKGVSLSLSTLLFPKVVLENKSRYIQNDVLSLDFEFVLATVKHFDCRKNPLVLQNDVTGKWKSQNTALLIDDFKSLYNDAIFSDTELRTLTTTFKAHKGILSARSPIFRSMFSNDMKEKNCGHVDITDFEDDIIHRMLLYIYTDSLDDMQYESACQLYAIADKYVIPSLKSRCSFFLYDNLCPANACEVLVLADLHNDEDLKSSVDDYVLRQSKQFFCSQEWKDFMNSRVKLAADIMHRKIIKCVCQDYKSCFSSDA